MASKAVETTLQGDGVKRSHPDTCPLEGSENVLEIQIFRLEVDSLFEVDGTR
jgi:hypothetical protein